MSGAFAALRGFRRRWADPEPGPGPESALASASEPENTLLSVTPDSASRSNGSFCLVELEGASVASSAAISPFPAFDRVGQQPCASLQLGQSVLRRPPLHGREWAPQRVDGIVPVAVEPCFRPVLQYRPRLSLSVHPWHGWSRICRHRFIGEPPFMIGARDSAFICSQLRRLPAHPPAVLALLRRCPRVCLLPFLLSFFRGRQLCHLTR